MITFDGWPWTRFTPEDLATFVASVREDLDGHVHNQPTDPTGWQTWAREVTTLREALQVLEASPQERDYFIRRARVEAYLARHPSPPPSEHSAPPGHIYLGAPARKAGRPPGRLRAPAIVSVFNEELTGRLASYRFPSAAADVRDLANKMEPVVTAQVEDWQAFLRTQWVHPPQLKPDATAAILRALTPFAARERRRKAGGILALAITAEAFGVGIEAVRKYIEVAARASHTLRLLRRVWRGTLDP
jgi:hypothetical protein